jgi:hypothetical protein
MPDLDLLRELGDQVRPPAFDSLERVARRRGHRTTGAVAAACAAVLLVVAGGVVVSGDDRATGPVAPVAPTPAPSQKPTPTQDPRPEPGSRTSMTPREVVNADNATLELAGLSLDDPDVRLSVWVAECRDCPVPEGLRSHPRFVGMALTTDGYATTTYLSSPFGEGTPATIASPTRDLFLLHDSSNGGAYLVGLDGVVRTVTSVDTPIAPKDPRLWYQCLSETVPDEPTWCALDPETATSYAMPGSWGNGLDMARPGSGEEQWGIRLGSNGRLEFWWDVDGSRQARPIPTAPGGSGVVRNPPGGGPMWWSWTPGSDTMQILIGRDRHAPWQVRERTKPPSAPTYLVLTGTPDGGLLAVRVWPRTKIWRADDLLTGDFSLVYDAGPGPENNNAGGDSLVLVGDEIQMISGDATVRSLDAGRTWTRVSTWR